MSVFATRVQTYKLTGLQADINLIFEAAKLLAFFLILLRRKDSRNVRAFTVIYRKDTLCPLVCFDQQDFSWFVCHFVANCIFSFSFIFSTLFRCSFPRSQPYPDQSESSESENTKTTSSRSSIIIH